MKEILHNIYQRTGEINFKERNVYIAILGSVAVGIGVVFVVWLVCRRRRYLIDQEKIRAGGVDAEYLGQSERLLAREGKMRQLYELIRGRETGRVSPIPMFMAGGSGKQVESRVYEQMRVVGKKPAWQRIAETSERE
ncbi:hypothetical protein BB559_005432 [Furculomyces boomerangus]|uniref:Uncharacterized protein n=2 Tax=Harpellales TaxID=61421 RepID=A0A2T9Y8P7_9FUNG|nr:hypothetical protein BB559_005432 [Furculomyces boomerangus]PWA01095.1 hypothetical protein BB558_002818 [Smittium angustum]